MASLNILLIFGLELNFSFTVSSYDSNIPIICLLVIPFSVIVSCIYSIDAGKIKACLSTIGNFVVAKEENAEISNIVIKLLYQSNKQIYLYLERKKVNI